MNIHSINWIIDENPPETISPDEILLVTVSRIINTEKGFESGTYTYPATIEFKDDHVEWHIIDELDSYTLVCDKDKTVVHNIVYDADEEVIDNIRTFENRIEMVIAWAHMPLPWGITNDAVRFTLTGYNRETKSNTVILENDNIYLLQKQTLRLLDIAKANHEFPFETPDGTKFDWLEIYKANEIGQLDKRLYYTNNDYELRYGHPQD